METIKEAVASRRNTGLSFVDGIQSARTSSNPFLRSLGKPGGIIHDHVIAFGGEFIGTFLFLFFAFTGTQVANSQTQGEASSSIARGSNPAQLLYISLCFGFSLGVNSWVFFRISGGLFNPAVTLGMCLVGAISWIRGLVVFVAQIVGGMASAAVVSALYPGPLNVRTTLSAGTSKAQGLFIEMFLTAMLVFTVFMLAAEKHKGTFIAPIGIGLALFIAELGGVYYTGGSLNPARSFGPDVVTHIFEDYHWIYWLGPTLGSLLASACYLVFKALDYGSANPGQDFDENETKLFDPEKGNGANTDRPMVNVIDASNLATSLELPAPPPGSSRRSNSRPISGDTLGGFGGRKEDSAGDGGAGPEDDDNITPAAPGSSEGTKVQGSSLLSPSPQKVAGPTKRGVHEDYYNLGVAEDVTGKGIGV